MPPTKHRQHWCGQYRLQQKPQRAAILSAVVLDDTLLPEQHLLAAMLYDRFEPHITQPTHYRAVVTHQELALTHGILRMLREDGHERATMSRVLQGNERAQNLVSLFLQRLDEQFRAVHARYHPLATASLSSTRNCL